MIHLEEAKQLLIDLSIILGHTPEDWVHKVKCKTCNFEVYSILQNGTYLLYKAAVTPCGELMDADDWDALCNKLAIQLNARFDTELFE